MLEFYMIFARKINKIPAFYTTFGRKCTNFTLRLPEKYFPFFLWGCNLLPSSLSYAYGWAPINQYIFRVA